MNRPKTASSRVGLLIGDVLYPPDVSQFTSPIKEANYGVDLAGCSRLYLILHPSASRAKIFEECTDHVKLKPLKPGQK